MVKTCKCRGYKFPHRMFGGKCLAEERGPFCGCCGMPCGVVWVEDGIGGYEFWGQVGVDMEEYPYSDCCEDIVFEDASLEREYCV